MLENILTNHAPAMSVDGGKNWQWLDPQCVSQDDVFTVTIADNANDYRLSMGMPYVKAQLDAFAPLHHDQLRISTLCQSPKGIAIPLWQMGPTLEQATYRVMFSARHHCCEMMASYVLEGLLEAAMTDPWWQEHVHVTAVPFVDIDGVAAGDQGKSRKPRDHNRDYDDKPIYPSTPVMMALVKEHCAIGLDILMDLHCPWIRHPCNEAIYMAHVGGEPFASNQARFSQCLESSITGTLPYVAADDIPFGTEWNTEQNYGNGCGFSKWAATQTGVSLSTTLEVPYATVRDKIIDQQNARQFGQEMALAIRNYLKNQ